VRVAIIGAGFAGIGAARQLMVSGIRDIVLLEREPDIGGSWRDNDYPGCTCDIPSNLYSFSFAPNPGWTSSFPGQREILGYLRDCVRRWDLAQHIQLNTEVSSAEWDERRRRWSLHTSRGRFGAEVLIAAAGPFDRPVVPDIPTLSEFRGAVFHSAEWNHDNDVTAQRVAVIGTGASAVQIVPAVAAKAKAVQVYQRTPHWVLPKKVRPVGRRTRALYRRVPIVQRLVRALHYWSRELPAFAIARRPTMLSIVERQARAHIAAQVPDPRLRELLTPDYAIFCRRVLLSSDYYPTLLKPHVELVTDSIDRFEADRIITVDGVERAADTVVLATGFAVTDAPITHRLFGRDGRSLAATWAAHGRSAYLGTCVAGFPNLFLCTGPNAGTGHTSLLVMIEAQINYIIDCLRVMANRGLGVVEVRHDAQRAFAERVQEAMAHTVWTTGGCSSYYLDATGRNTTLWPGPTWTFHQQTSRFDVEPYRVFPITESLPKVTKEDEMDTREEIHSLVVNFLAEVCSVDSATIKDDSRLADVDLDSLELVVLVQELQKRYDVALNDERLLGLDTVGQLVDLVVLRIAQEHHPVGAGD
jgi:acyl carrier protein